VKVDESGANKLRFLPRGFAAMHEVAPDLVGPQCEVLGSV
jgi:hypothetical protein